MNTTHVTVSIRGTGKHGPSTFSVVRYNGFAPQERTEPEVHTGSLRRFIRAEKRVRRHIIVNG